MADGSIARTLRVLDAVCEYGPQTLKALAERTDLAAPTLLRILRLMAEEGFVLQEADRRWRGTMLVWRLGCAVNATVGIEAVSREHTERLTTELDETSVYAVYEQQALTYATHAEPLKPVRAHVRLGSRHELLAVITGHAVLAYLDEPSVEHAIAEERAAGHAVDPEEVATMLAGVRKNGYASGTGVRWSDLWGCAAPVFGPSGKPVGALGISVPAVRAQEIKDKVVAALVREAATMSRELGQPARAS